jgi:hypothetical protein
VAEAENQAPTKGDNLLNNDFILLRRKASQRALTPMNEGVPNIRFRQLNALPASYKLRWAKFAGSE